MINDDDFVLQLTVKDVSLLLIKINDQEFANNYH